MLEHLYLESFKAFDQIGIPLRPLTLLTGMNGMGKSSVMQSLLLLRQSYMERLNDERSDTPRLVLNGDLVQLGTGRDIYHRAAQREEIGFTVDFTEGRMVWRYDYVPTSNALKPQVNRETQFDLAATCLFNDRFHYLQAERLGPRSTYAFDDFQVRERRNFGVRGEFIPHFLHYWNGIIERLDVHPAMHYPQETHEKQLPGTLIPQVEAWMGEISPGVRFKLNPLDDTDLIQMQIGFGDEFFRATNVGFGISYTLPIVVALLSSTEGDLLLLENPEAHLHPRGQSRIGELIARAASIGVQVLVETHSDHVLNGIRIAVKRGLCPPDGIAVHYFMRKSGDVTQVISPTMNADGKLNEWPEGFFDEIDRSLDELLS